MEDVRGLLISLSVLPRTLGVFLMVSFLGLSWKGSEMLI